VSRGRFALLLSLLCLVVAAASFAAVLTLLDDDGPLAGTDDTAQPDGGTGGTGDGSATTGAPLVVGGVLVTPAFVVIVASEGSEADADEEARSVQTAGYPAGYLLSDDFESLTPGFWVAFAGPYPDAATANAEVEPLAGAGFPGAYVRCVGTTEECR
jgi:hypothetical protein